MIQKDSIYQKIKTLDQLAVIIQRLKSNGKKIIHCHGVFDLLHPGHIHHLESAKREGDILIVTITKDEYVGKGPGRPVFNQKLRSESIAALQCVDYVAINEWPTATKAILKLKPDIYVKGKDYMHRTDDITGKIYEEEDAVKSIDGRIHFTDDETFFSSSHLINMHFDVYPEETKDFFKYFRNRYSTDEIIKRIKESRDMKVLVIGDAIIDEYHYCTALNRSQKDIIIAMKYLSEEKFAGGALATANHMAGFCKDVHLITCIGNRNNYKRFITSHLKPNVKTKFFYREDIPTIVKRRFVEPSFLVKVFEICFIDDTQLPKPIENEIHSYLSSHVKDYDLVLVADFGHGLITKRIVDILCKKAKFLAVNTQTNSANIGFNLVTKYKRADYICIDEPEIRLACYDKFSNLDKLILDLTKKIKCDKIIVTRGHLGSLGYSKNEGFSQIPAFSKKIVDRVGAGDAYFSITSPFVRNGSPIEVAGFIGNAVGALAVLIVGNRSSVEPTPLFKFITTLLR